LSKFLAFKTKLGCSYNGASEEVLNRPFLRRKKGSVQLVFTSPPYPLKRKKKYGNRNGQEYIDWLVGIIGQCKDLLTENGSIAIEIGNAWEAGRPVMSTLVLKTLLAIQEELDLHLCQEFIVHNPARVPGPAQWVNIERIRVKDSFTRIWWLSPSERPKADNRNVLQEYSRSMKKLLATGKYNEGMRPSEHDINGKSFLKNNGGAIPPNVITVANTSSSDPYQNFCKQNGIELHPARMPSPLAEFFINFLTDSGDTVLDPFAGSNTTGQMAEKLNRKWISIEANNEYIKGSIARFANQGRLPKLRLSF